MNKKEILENIQIAQKAIETAGEVQRIQYNSLNESVRNAMRYLASIGLIEAIYNHGTVQRQRGEIVFFKINQSTIEELRRMERDTKKERFKEIRNTIFFICKIIGAIGVIVSSYLAINQLLNREPIQTPKTNAAEQHESSIPTNDQMPSNVITNSPDLIKVNAN